MKAGEEKDLDITFPEDYHADLAGKAVVFHVKVNEVKEPQAPEVDDEFAKDVSEFETLEAFRKDLGEKLTPAPQQSGPGATLRTPCHGAADRQHGVRDPRRHGGGPAGQA